MVITLNTPVEKVTRPEETKTFTELEVERIVDLPIEKKVKAFVVGFGAVELWTGDDYDAIGQWTDTDVEDRLKVLFS